MARIDSERRQDRKNLRFKDRVNQLVLTSIQHLSAHDLNTVGRKRGQQLVLNKPGLSLNEPPYVYANSTK
jgi:hypothetical protein